MGNNWGKAAVLGLAVLAVSPKARQQLKTWMNDLNLALERDARRKEAQRQADLIQSAIAQLQIAPAATLPAYNSPTPIALAEPDARWREVVVPPAVVLILGKRGSGKSALAYRLLELFRYKLTPYVVGVPAQANKLLPTWVSTVPSLEDLPPDCIAVVDEAYILFHSRRSMGQDSTAMSQALNLSRQRNQTLLFVSQEARQVDKNIASSASVVVFKDLGVLQPEFDRSELRKLVIQASEALSGIHGDKRRWAYVYSPDADYLGLLPSQLPTFWKPSLSRMYVADRQTASPRHGGKLSSKEKAARALELRSRGYSYGQIMQELGVSKSSVVNYLKGYPYRRA